MHNKYGHSAFFGIYIRVDYNDRNYIIPGSLLLSLKFPQDKKPLLKLIKNNESRFAYNDTSSDLQKMNHSVVGEDGMINTDLFKNWNDVAYFRIEYV